MLINELKPNSGKKTSPPQDRWDKLAGAIVAATSAVSGKAGASVGATVPPATSKATGGVGVAVSGTNSNSVRTAGSSGSGSSAALNDTQREEAALVARLPADFPFEQWDSMPTKAQLVTMQNSGLNTQEQWRLHNPSTPLEVLALVNTAQSRVNSGTLTDREANDLIDRSLRYAAARYQLTSGNASSLPPLQKGLLRGKLEEVIADLHKKVDGTSSDGSTATPSPRSTPLPQPGPSIPVQTPAPAQNTGSNIQPKAEPLPLPPGVIDPKKSYTWYRSYQDAAEAWAQNNRGLSKDIERCALIYRNVDETGKEHYTFGLTKPGMKGIPFLNIRDNVFFPFISLYLGEIVPNSSCVGFIHTHPAPPEGYTVANASKEDLFLLNLPGIDYVTIVPYENQDIDTEQ